MSVGSSPLSLLPRARKLRIAAAYYAAYFLLGLMLTSIGPCSDALKAQSRSTLEQISYLVVVMSAGYIIGSIAGGRLYGRLAGNRILAASLLAMALLTVTLPWLAELWLLIVMFALIGVALGIMDVGGNTLMVWLYGRDVPPYMNALHLCFGIGALVGPLVMNGFAAATGSAANTYWFYAGLMIPVTLWLVRILSPESPPVEQPAVGIRSALRRHALLIGLISAFFFMHMGAELSFGAFITPYAQDQVLYSESMARVVNSMFWGGLVVGRLIAIPLARRLSAGAMLQMDLAGLAASIAVIGIWPHSTVALWIGTIGLGVSIASMIPSSINYAGERMPITGQITALFLVGASLGSTVLPLIVGQLYGEEPALRPQTMVYVTAAAVAAAIVLFGVIAAYTRRAHQKIETAS
jgi:fucose permease